MLSIISKSLAFRVIFAVILVVFLDSSSTLVAGLQVDQPDFIHLKSPSIPANASLFLKSGASQRLLYNSTHSSSTGRHSTRHSSLSHHTRVEATQSRRGPSRHTTRHDSRQTSTGTRQSWTKSTANATLHGTGTGSPTAGSLVSLITSPPSPSGGMQNVWSVHTLSNVTGAPSSYSQTTTINRNGSPTILPIWFNNQGLGIVVSLHSGPGGAPPSPFDFFGLFIDGSGEAEPEDDDEDEDHTTTMTTTTTSVSLESQTSSSTSHSSSQTSSSTSHNSSSSSTSLSRNVSSTSVSAGWTHTLSSNGSSGLWDSHSTGHIVRTAASLAKTTNSSTAYMTVAVGQTSPVSRISASPSIMRNISHIRPSHGTGTFPGAISTITKSNSTNSRLTGTPNGCPYKSHRNGTGCLSFASPSVTGTPLRNSTNPDPILHPQRLLFPKDGDDPRNAEITRALAALTNSSSTTMTDPFGGIDFWMALLSRSQIQRFEANPLVRKRSFSFTLADKPRYHSWLKTM